MYHCYDREITSIKNTKHDFFFNLAKKAKLGKAKNENFKWHIFNGKHFIRISLKGTGNRFSITYLVCATELTKYATYGKVHWVVLKLF